MISHLLRDDCWAPCHILESGSPTNLTICIFTAGLVSFVSHGHHHRRMTELPCNPCWSGMSQNGIRRNAALHQCAESGVTIRSLRMKSTEMRQAELSAEKNVYDSTIQNVGHAEAIQRTSWSCIRPSCFPDMLQISQECPFETLTQTSTVPVVQRLGEMLNTIPYC